MRSKGCFSTVLAIKTFILSVTRSSTSESTTSRKSSWRRPGAIILNCFLFYIVSYFFLSLRFFKCQFPGIAGCDVIHGRLLFRLRRLQGVTNEKEQRFLDLEDDVEGVEMSNESFMVILNVLNDAVTEAWLCGRSSFKSTDQCSTVSR